MPRKRKTVNNRTDLQKPQVPKVATGSVPYGQRQKLEEAQRVMPAGAPPSFAPMEQVEEAVRRIPAPPKGGLLAQPSARPDEPLTTGLPIGPGAGPEAIPNLPQRLNPDLMAFAPYLPTLELVAAQPGATVQFRNFVRRLRGAMPRERQ